MNTRAQLMLLAAALAPLPLYAQDAAPAAVPAAIVAPATAQLPAELASFSPLAVIPAGVDAAFIVPDFGKRLASIFGENEATQAIGSVAVGFGKGNAALAEALYGLQCRLAMFDIGRGLSEGWSSVAKEDLRGAIKDAFTALHHDNVDAMRDTLAGLKLHPVYAVLAIPAGKESFVARNLDDLLDNMKESAEMSADTEFVTIGGLSGVKVTFPKKNRHAYCGDDCCYAPDPDEELMDNMLDDEMAKRTAYVLFGMVGGNVVAVVCEDPAEITFAKSVEESVLGTKEWEAAKTHAKDDVFFAASASADTCNAGFGHVQVCLDAFGSVSTVFEKMAGKDAECAAKFKAAAAGLEAIHAQLKGAMAESTATKPAFFQVWGTPGAVHAELTGDACGATFQPAKLALATKAADSDTIFTIEGTPLTCTKGGLQAIDCQTLGSATLDVYHGVMASLAPQLQQDVEGKVQQAAAFLPEIAAAVNALGTIADGMGGTAGLVVDGKGTAPSYLTGGEIVSIPRVALYCGVRDRAKLAEGWDALLCAAGDLMEKCGQDRAMLDMLPIVPREVAKGVMSYSVAVPFTTMDMGANVTVGDAHFAAGTSANLNQEIVTCGTGTQEFAGITFTLHTQPLAATSRSIADAMLKAAGPIEKQRYYFDDEDEEEGCDYVEYEAPTSDQCSALRARNIAEGLENLAAAVKEISGSITIKDDVETIHVDVILTSGEN